MSETAIRKMVIVGGGTAGWMAAAAFSTLLPRNSIEIVLVESDEIGTVGVGEATIPPLIAFNDLLGINEDEFVAATQGTFKLGIEFVDWGAIGEGYFHPFGSHGADLNGVHFHQFYLRELKRSALPDIRQWSMSGVAAELGRFARPGPGARLPLSQLIYAFHFDAGLYARFLRSHAECNGVQRIEGKIVDVTLDGESGHVRGVKLDSGTVIDGELFIDCSGFRGLLIEDKLGTGYEVWTRWLPCDRAIAVPCKLPGPPDPFTRSTARAAGWQWRIPLQHRMGNGLVYSSAHLDREGAEALLLANLEGEPLAQPRHLSFTAGRRRLAWNANVVSLGLSSGFIEPLESTSIHLVQSALGRLLNLLPGDLSRTQSARDYFNRLSTIEWERVRDFITLHYFANNRDGDFWELCRNMQLPDTLLEKITLFREAGLVIREDEELFLDDSWGQAMIGQGISPESWSPLADNVPGEDIGPFLESVAKSYRVKAESLPTHRQFVASMVGNAVKEHQ